MSEASRTEDTAREWTVAALLAWTTTRFAEAGIDGARLDAERLLAHALGCRRLDLYLRHGEVVGVEPRQRFRDFVRRRLSREPVALIEGTRAFHGLALDLYVDRNVLIPRPETEILVDRVLERLTPMMKRVVDVGTGSGAIALALVHARKDLELTATDVSEAAIAVARRNAAALRISVNFVLGDLLSALPSIGLALDCVVANLPYIPSSDLPGLMPEVRDFEPHLALDGGGDGLVLVRRLLSQALRPGVLSAEGFVALELGIGQPEALGAELRAQGLHVEIHNDLARIPRVLLVRPEPWAPLTPRAGHESARHEGLAWNPALRPPAATELTGGSEREAQGGAASEGGRGGRVQAPIERGDEDTQAD